MPATVSIPQSAVLTALGNFVVSVTGATVVQGYPNRVAMPVGPFVNMSALSMKRLRTNIDNYAGTVTSPPAPGPVTSEQGTQIDIQLDCYGPSSGDWATILTTLLRDNVGCVALAPNCQPLYADDPIRAPLTTAEEQYLDRWIITVRLQMNPTVTTSQQFASVLGPVGIIDAEVAYPP
jgi:hypothetical protein